MNKLYLNNKIYIDFSSINLTNNFLISFLYVCMVNTIISISIISTDEDPSLRIESSAIINLRGVSTKLNKYNSFFPYRTIVIKVDRFHYLKLRFANTILFLFERQYCM